MLRLDQPVPERSDVEITAERDRNFRWNFTVNLLDGANFWVGRSFISFATIVPLYISKLTDSTLAIGLAAVIAQGAWFLPQVFTSNFVQRLPRMKPMVVNAGFFLERLPLWLIVLSAVVAFESAEIALLLFMIGYAWHGFGAGTVATAWQDLIARCFSVERRGRLFGISMFVGAFAGAAAAVLSARLLDEYPFPTSFVIIFFLAAIFIMVSWVFLALTREPAQTPKAPRQSTRQFWHELPTILRQDDNYRRFLVARLLLALSGMGLGFVTVAAIRQWDVADATVGGYTAVFLIGQTSGNLFFGFLADRHGHKLVLELGTLAAFLAFSLAWLAPAAELYFVVFFLLGVMEGAIIVSGILVVMEFSTPEKRPTYTGLTNTSVGVVSMVGPLIGAALALTGYDWLFLVSAALSLLALIALHWWVREPRYIEASTKS
jgi:MFS family permease